MSKKVLFTFFIGIIILIALSGTAFAADITIDDAYLSANPGSYDVSANGHVSGDTITVSASTPVTLTGIAPAGVRVDCAAGTYLITDNLQIEPGSVGMSGITFTGAGNTLYTVGYSFIHAAENYPGITVNAGTTLTFDGEPSSDISAYSGGPFAPNSTAAAIGSYSGVNCGTIIVEDTHIFGDCYGVGAGVGGGLNGTGGTIIVRDSSSISSTGINGRAFGPGAGIGGGEGADGGTLNFYGGASAGDSSSDGAGIGGGDQGSAGTITVDGGSIRGESVNGAGIGCGANVGTNTGSINVIEGWLSGISDLGAGLGGGINSSAGTISITSTGANENYLGATNGRGIGSGSGAVTGGTITIGGQAFVAAEGNGVLEDIGGVSSLVITDLAEVYTLNGLFDSSLSTSHTLEPGTLLPAASADLTGVGAAYNFTSPAAWEFLLTVGYFADRTIAAPATNPQTGDSNNIAFMIIIAAVALMALLSVYVMKRRKSY